LALITRECQFAFETHEGTREAPNYAIGVVFGLSSAFSVMRGELQDRATFLFSQAELDGGYR
jgi:hypothetical protein